MRRLAILRISCSSRNRARSTRREHEFAEARVFVVAVVDVRRLPQRAFPVVVVHAVDVGAPPCVGARRNILQRPEYRARDENSACPVDQEIQTAPEYTALNLVS